VTPTQVQLPASPAARPAAGAPGVLHIVVRDLIEPTRAVAQAEIHVRPATAAPSESIWTGPYLTSDAGGQISRDALTPGIYEVAVRRVGYSAFVTRVAVRAACTTWLELYAVGQGCDLGACPPLPEPRATATTCAPATSRTLKL